MLPTSWPAKILQEVHIYQPRDKHFLVLLTMISFLSATPKDRDAAFSLLY